MKIMTVSDRVEPSLIPTHGPQPVQGIDLILSCGDLPPEYLAQLHDAFHAPLFYVRGNHDIRYDSASPRGCRDLNGQIEEFGGIKFLGIEGSRWYNGGPNQYTENQMRHIVFGLRPKLWWRKGVDIIFTHAPPRHIHDAEDLCHRGFKSFKRLIERYRPAYFIHGHIHTHFDNPSERITHINETKVVNTYGHYIFEIKADGPAESA
jgi:uncharacterized protein